MRSASSRKPAPNYFSRREQLRLLTLVSALMLVLIMMNEARKPANWHWLWGQQESTSPVDVQPSVDTRITPPRQPTLPADGFSTSDGTGRSESDGVGQSDRRLLTESNPSGTPSQQTPSHDHSLPALPPRQLDEGQLISIEDDTIFRAAERETFLTVIDWLREHPQQELVDMPAAEVGFLQLYQQMPVYRGRLVRFSGTVRRIELIQTSNELGISQYFRWSIEPAANATAPIIVYSLEKPPELPLDVDPREFCSFVGIAYKRWAYLAGDGTRVAPLVIARTAIWSPPAPAADSAARISPEILWISSFAVAALAGLIAWGVYRQTQATPAAVDRLRPQAEEDLDAMIDETLPDVKTSLRRLSEADRGQSS